MSYVQRVLQPGETVVHQSRLHPLIFLPALLLLVIAVALFVASMQFTGDIKIGLQAAAAIFALPAADNTRFLTSVSSRFAEPPNAFAAARTPLSW